MGYDNTRFSNLVYKIIGTPERWHSDYIDVMNQVLDDSAHIDDPKNVTELKIGDQILNRISNTNEAMMAFGSLLDNGRFKMVILDSTYRVIYHNKTADHLLNYLLVNKTSNQLKPSVMKKLELTAKQNQELALKANHGGLSAVDYLDQNDEQVYLRSIHSRNEINGSLATHYLVLVVDQSARDKALNPEFISRYDLTDKEQAVLVKLIHGQSIKQLAETSFVSGNTIKSHLQSLYRKTNTASQAEIIHLALTDESQILDTYFGIRESVLPLLEQQNEDKFVCLKNGHQIAYRDYGPADGDVIIFCHNGYGSRVSIPHNYREICERQNKRIIIPDRPGYGLTPYADPSKWNSMLNEFVDLLDIQQYQLLGSVLGSAVALNFAAQADQRMRKLSLCSPVFVNKPDDTSYLTGIFAPVTRLIKASKRIALEIYQLWLKSVTLNLAQHYGKMLTHSIGSAEVEQFHKQGTVNLMIDGFIQGSSRGVEGIANDMVHCLSPRNIDLGKIDVPVTLWWGSEDARINQSGVKRIAAQLKDATVEVREGYSEHIYYALFEQIISQ